MQPELNCRPGLTWSVAGGSNATPTVLDRVDRALADCATRIRRLEAALAPVVDCHAFLRAEHDQLVEQWSSGQGGKLAVVRGHVERLAQEAVELNRRAEVGRTNEAHTKVMLRAKVNLMGKIVGQMAVDELAAEGTAVKRRCRYLDFTVTKVRNEREKEVGEAEAKQAARRTEGASAFSCDVP